MRQKVPSDDARQGDATPASVAAIDRFVAQRFGGAAGIDARNRIWFRNYGPLRSVDGLEHFHILMRLQPGSARAADAARLARLLE